MIIKYLIQKFYYISKSVLGNKINPKKPSTRNRLAIKNSDFLVTANAYRYSVYFKPLIGFNANLFDRWFIGYNLL